MYLKSPTLFSVGMSDFTLTQTFSCLSLQLCRCMQNLFAAVTAVDSRTCPNDMESLVETVIAVCAELLLQHCWSVMQTLDPAPIPAALKASLRDQLAALGKKVLEGQKKASATNKQRATQVCSLHSTEKYSSAEN